MYKLSSKNVKYLIFEGGGKFDIFHFEKYAAVIRDPTSGAIIVHIAIIVLVQSVFCV